MTQTVTVYRNLPFVAVEFVSDFVLRASDFYR
jgi:hypothetical protein